MPRRFAISVICLASLLLAPLGGCETLNVGGARVHYGPIPTIGAGPDASTNFSGETFTWTATWPVGWGAGGTPPFTVSWNFGPDFTPELATAPVTEPPSSQVVTLNNAAGASGVVTVTVTDSQGVSGSDTGDYSFGWNESPLTTLVIVGGDGTNDISVQADDPDGDDITITATPPPGFTVGGPQTVPSGGTATFHFTADDIFAGGTGTAFFDGVSDGIPPGHMMQVSATVTQGAIVLAADTLYAIPLQGSAAVGEPVRIVVATGVPANPFQFMNGCRVTAPNGFDYVADTFNIGAAGGLIGDVDGFWTNMNPGAGFLLAPDDIILANGDDSGGPGMGSIDFQVTPLGGSDGTTASGALFNFEATFAPGLNVLGFQDIQGVNRTYYSDGSATEYFWGDISNNHAGVPNSVMVE